MATQVSLEQIQDKTRGTVVTYRARDMHSQYIRTDTEVISLPRCQTRRESCQTTLFMAPSARVALGLVPQIGREANKT